MNIKKFNEDVRKFLPNFQIQTTVGYDEKTDQEVTYVQLQLGMTAALEPKDANPEFLVTQVRKQLEAIINFSVLVGKGDPLPPAKAKKPRAIKTED